MLRITSMFLPLRFTLLSFFLLPMQLSRYLLAFQKKAGGLKWTRTTDLTLIRRAL